VGQLAQQSAPHGRVLVVDDDVFVRRIMRMALQDTHEVVEASDGTHALGILRARPRDFDLVLCDVEMPSMNGAQLYAELAAQLPEVLDDVVMITGGPRTADLREFVAAREPAVLHKPFEMSRLRELVRERIAARRSG
jgi:CheY-like chemotaxis protein